MRWMFYTLPEVDSDAFAEGPVLSVLLCFIPFFIFSLGFNVLLLTIFAKNYKHVRSSLDSIHNNY